MGSFLISILFCLQRYSNARWSPTVPPFYFLLARLSVRTDFTCSGGPHWIVLQKGMITGGTETRPTLSMKLYKSPSWHACHQGDALICRAGCMLSVWVGLAACIFRAPHVLKSALEKSTL